jgi:hypothetical protein
MSLSIDDGGDRKEDPLFLFKDEDEIILSSVTDCLENTIVQIRSNNDNLDTLMEGTKACSVVTRILQRWRIQQKQQQNDHGARPTASSRSSPVRFDVGV